MPDQMPIPDTGINMTGDYRSHAGAAAVVLTVFYVGIAWAQRFFMDDAFISFRYAANLVHGHGLVWNPGELPVEGYSNFLWVLIMSVPIRLGADPVLFSMVLGILLFTMALAAQYQLVTLVTGEPWAGVAGVLALGGLYTFRAFATGGLETMLQTFLLLFSVWLAAEVSARRDLRNSKLLLLSLVVGAAFLTRMDSALIAALLLTWIAWLLIRYRTEKRWTGFIALISPLFLISISWLAWKYNYYGSILPNTFYIKFPSELVSAYGLSYVHTFLVSYFFYPLLLLIIVAIFRKPRLVPQIIWVLSWICLMWTAYIIRVGGDFMEYRFMVPVLPLFIVILVWATWIISRSLTIRGLVLILVLAGSVHHQLTHRASPENPLIESTKQLQLHLSDEGMAWISTGKVLGQLLPDAPGEPVTIAIVAAGAVPYYSNLRTIDMMGLSDRWIAQNGLYAPANGPGHKRIAPLSYLMEQGVHILIGHPDPSSFMATFPTYVYKAILWSVFNEKENVRQLPSVVDIIEIPVTTKKKLVAIYLQKHERIDDLIARGFFRSYKVKINGDAATVGDES
ncbi:MAG: hypothetical protein P1S46_08105 [bacterium]|nr:hypothetical protein [bacterium]